MLGAEWEVTLARPLSLEAFLLLWADSQGKPLASLDQIRGLEQRLTARLAAREKSTRIEEHRLLLAFRCRALSALGSHERALADHARLLESPATDEQRRAILAFAAVSHAILAQETGQEEHLNTSVRHAVKAGGRCLETMCRKLMVRPMALT